MALTIKAFVLIVTALVNPPTGGTEGAILPPQVFQSNELCLKAKNDIDTFIKKNPSPEMVGYGSLCVEVPMVLHGDKEAQR